MSGRRSITPWVSVSVLWWVACATGGTDGDPKIARERVLAVESLQLQTGAPIALEVNDAGTARVLTMTPRFPVPGHATDPAVVAKDFVASYRGAFQLDAAEATQFAVTRVDDDPTTGLRHVTLNRTYHGILVFQGGITVHMDSGNNVFLALGDESYNIVAPDNRLMLSPSEAAAAAGRALGVKVSPVLTESDDQHAVFTSVGTLDPIHVDPKIVHVARGDDRFAYQVILSWLDEQKQQQYELALIDAQDGALLGSHSLVNTFIGKVFNVNAQPTATLATDTRTEVSFDGDPTASPQGWVTTPANRTVGNNAVAATDLNGDNTVGANETQPTAVNNAFDFMFDPTADASSFKAAAVANAFFLVNDYHDRTYKLGFTEASGNFQTSNFGKGGVANDPVNVDAQDGSGTNNANFSTPPDGSRPRMQMFLFNLKNGAGGVRQDGDFDPSVIYHENSHGLSNRLVGGGSTACLGGLQSGGMGEGWGDFLGGSFLNNPVVGAYVTGNATRGIRQFPMNNAPWTYNDVKNGTLAEVHGVGELWAAILWDIRTALGAAITEQLVVQGMKLTPCHPTIIDAKEAIISVDANLNGGIHNCRLWEVFAARRIGVGASSPNDNSTSAIVTSTAIPASCQGVLRSFTSTDVPKSIPDNNATGVRSVITVPAGLADTLQVTTDVNVTHTFRGDLVIQVISPSGQVATLSNRQGGSADDFIATGLDISASFTTSSPSGQWQLFVRDLAAVDVGTINSFALHIRSTN